MQDDRRELYKVNKPGLWQYETRARQRRGGAAFDHVLYTEFGGGRYYVGHEAVAFGLCGLTSVACIVLCVS